MNREAKVTVLIAIHNGESSIDRCFDSIAKQSFQAFDIICIDDASTDKTPDLLRDWQRKFGQRLRVARNTRNLGLTKSLNKGLAFIRAPYTARIDVDDWWRKDKLTKQLAFMEQHPDYGVIGCNYVNISSVGENQIVVPETDREIRESMARRNPLAHSCVMFRTEFIKKMGGYDEAIRFGQDYELWLRCLPHTKFYNLQGSLCYRTVGRGISVDKQREQMWQSIKTQARYIRKFRLSPANYLALIEPLLLVLTPTLLKTLKRKLLG